MRSIFMDALDGDRTILFLYTYVFFEREQILFIFKFLNIGRSTYIILLYFRMVDLRFKIFWLCVITHIMLLIIMLFEKKIMNKNYL